MPALAAASPLKERFAAEIARLRQMGNLSVHESDDTFYVNLKPGTVRVLKAGNHRAKARMDCIWLGPSEFVSIAEMRVNADCFAALTAFAEIVAATLELSLSSTKADERDKPAPRSTCDPMQLAYRRIMDHLTSNAPIDASLEELIFILKGHEEYGTVFGEQEIRACFWWMIEHGMAFDSPTGYRVHA